MEDHSLALIIPREFPQTATLESAMSLSDRWDLSMSLEENLQNTPLMLLLLWNCRGANNVGFKNHMQELNNYHKLSIIILIETKVSSDDANTIFQHFWYDHLAKVDAEGASGGLYAMLNNNISIQKTLANIPGT